jgi:hypothetical protein
VALSPLQEQVAALIAALPESEGFVLAGGAAMAAHSLLDRSTRDLDYFGGPTDAGVVQRLAASVEAAATGRGLRIERHRDAPAFVRFRVSDDRDECELDLGIDYRALEPAQTPYGPALDLRELGANKMLAIFDRAEARDFIDLAQLTRRFVELDDRSYQWLLAAVDDWRTRVRHTLDTQHVRERDVGPDDRGFEPDLG